MQRETEGGGEWGGGVQKSGNEHRKFEKQQSSKSKTKEKLGQCFVTVESLSLTIVTKLEEILRKKQKK